MARWRCSEGTWTGFSRTTSFHRIRRAAGPRIFPARSDFFLHDLPDPASLAKGPSTNLQGGSGLCYMVRRRREHRHQKQLPGRPRPPISRTRRSRRAFMDSTGHRGERSLGTGWGFVPSGIGGVQGAADGAQALMERSSLADKSGSGRPGAPAADPRQTPRAHAPADPEGRPFAPTPRPTPRPNSGARTARGDRKRHRPDFGATPDATGPKATH